MCGRFSNRLTWSELHELMGLLGAPLNLRPRYNAAPGQDVTAVRAAAGRRLLAALGPIPAWARDAAIGHRLINARSETAAAMGNTHWGVVPKNDIPGVVCEPPHL